VDDEADVVSQLRAPQIEMPVTETEFLRRQRLAAIARDGNHRGLRGTDDTQRLPAHLDLAVASSAFRISAVARPPSPVTRTTLSVPSEPAIIERLSGGDARIERHLHDARAIAKIDEHQAAEIASAVNPPAEANLSPDVLLC
jgi:hypothetical protein